MNAQVNNIIDNLARPIYESRFIYPSRFILEHKKQKRTKRDMEKQERDLVKYVTLAYEKLGPHSIVSTSQTSFIENIIGAHKLEGHNELGKEHYTDLVFVTSEGRHINISAKGTTSPAIAGGGLVGALSIFKDKDLIRAFLENAEKWLLNNGFEEGDYIPDIYGQVNDSDKEMIILGTKEMGGPIDYLYIGPMDVEYAIDEKRKALLLNGELIPAKLFAEKNDIFVRMRKRRKDQPFVPGVRDKKGYPLIVGRSPTKGDRGRRIAFVAGVPLTANVVEF
jgi:hypothetical protein